MFKTTIAWLIASSQNPQQVSLTVIGIIALIVSASIFFGHPVEQSQLTDIVSEFWLFVQQATAALGTGLTLYGGVRKIVLTIMGKNQVLAAMRAQ